MAHVPGERLPALQRQVLVPLELDLMREPTSPRSVVDHVARALRDDDGRAAR